MGTRNCLYPDTIFICYMEHVKVHFNFNKVFVLANLFKNFYIEKVAEKNFQRNWLDLYFHHDWKNALKLQKSSSLKDAVSCYGQKFVSSDNPSQNIWHKLKKYSKLDKTLTMQYLILHLFWQLLSKFKFWKEDWALHCVSTHISIFSNIS